MPIHQEQDRLETARVQWAIFLVAAVLSLAQALYLFPVDFIQGHGAYWAGLRADSQVSVVGMRYFLADEWRFPLTQSLLLMAPGGVNIVYTDSIPLMALLTKLVAFVLPDGVNYFGIWYVTAYVLQGVGAVYLVRSLSIRAVVPQLAAAVLAISLPAFLFRSTLHPSLVGHFIILFALGLYFTSTRRPPTLRTWIAFTGLLLAALLIHAYLFVMAGLIFAAALAQYMTKGRGAAMRGAIAGMITVSCVALVMWLTGYLNSSGVASGFGHYSMNVLSPWVPQRSGLIPGAEHIIDATGGQHEGFNYLGLGILLLLFLTVVAERRKLVAKARRYWALSLVLCGFFLLALSNRIFVGNRAIVELASQVHAVEGPGVDPVSKQGGAEGTPPPEETGIVDFAKSSLQQFRSSGRFFWPIAYVLLALGVVGVTRVFAGAKGVAIVVLAVGLQLVDTGPLRREIRDKFSGSVRMSEMPPSLQFPPDVRWNDAVITTEIWESFIGGHDALMILPTFECAGQETRWHVLDLVFQASSTATPANTSYLARRPPTTHCDTQVRGPLKDELTPGKLMVFLTPPVPEEAVASMPWFSTWCRSFSLGYACTHSWDQAAPGVFEIVAIVGNDPGGR